jgi:hypothetical protein
MTLQLTLPPDLENRLRLESNRRGLSPDEVTVKLLDEHLPAAGRSAAFLALLQQWQAEDEAMTDEEGASNAEVLRAIDADRLSNRKLFTELLKDDPT